MAAQSPTPITTAMRVLTTTTVTATHLKSLFSPQPSGGFEQRQQSPIMYSMRHDTITSAGVAVGRHGRWLGGERKESSQFETWGQKLASSPLLGFDQNPQQDGRQTDIDSNLCFGGKLKTWVRNFELGFKIPAWKHRRRGEGEGKRGLVGLSRHVHEVK